MDEKLHELDGLDAPEEAATPAVRRRPGRPPGSGRGKGCGSNDGVQMTTLSLKLPSHLKRRMAYVAKLLGNDLANFMRRMIVTHLPDYEAEVAKVSPPGRPQPDGP